MRCDEIIRLLEKKAPIEYAMDWDHVGLLVGRRDKEVHKLMLVVDVTEAVSYTHLRAHETDQVSRMPSSA